MQNTENTPSLLSLLEDTSDMHGLILKTQATATTLYEALNADCDFSARVGEGLLANAAEVICDYINSVNNAVSDLYLNLYKLYTIQSEN